MILEKDQEITSLQHKLSILEADLEKTEMTLSELKSAHAVGETSRETNDNLNRKIQLLEEELDAAEKNVKETVEKSVCFSPRHDSSCLTFTYIGYGKSTLRQNILSVKCNASNKNETSGRRSAR